MKDIDPIETPSASEQAGQSDPASPSKPPIDESWASGQRKRYLASLPHQDP